MQPFQAQESASNDPIYPEIPLRHPHKSFTTAPEESPSSRYQFYRAQTEPMLCEPASRPGRFCQPFAADYGTTPEGPQQPPQFREKSGGFTNGYEYGAGFGDSARPSDVRGVGNASRRVPPTEGFGVGLSDVPTISRIQRKPVGCR
jgi:hypothetical protein